MENQEQVQAVEETKPEAEVSTPSNVADALVNSLLNDGITKQESNIVNNEAQSQQQAQPAEQQQPEEEILDEDAYKLHYLKNTWGVESEDALKEELNNLRSKANEKPFEFKNEDSKKIAEYINEGKIDDLYLYLDNQKKIDKLASADLSNNKQLAVELVKFGMQRDNPNLSNDDIDFLFEQKYSLPEKPLEAHYDTDDEYKAAVSAWEQKVNNIDRALVIEAKIAQPKLSQLKAELVLPDIAKPSEQQQQAQPTPEELAKFEADKKAAIQSAKQQLDSFNGFSVQFKDKDVDYTVSYAPSAEEKSLVESRLQGFVESGFDANALFYDRWVDEKGALNYAQLVKDYMKIVAGEKAEQKLVTDAVGKRMEALVAARKNININGQQQQGVFSPAPPKNQQEVLADAFLSVR